MNSHISNVTFTQPKFVLHVTFTSSTRKVLRVPDRLHVELIGSVVVAESFKKKSIYKPLQKMSRYSYPATGLKIHIASLFRLQCIQVACCRR